MHGAVKYHRSKVTYLPKMTVCSTKGTFCCRVPSLGVIFSETERVVTFILGNGDVQTANNLGKKRYILAHVLH